MVPSLNPPTDNLYKFIGVSGLALIVLGSVLSARAYERLHHSGAQLGSEIAVLDAQAARIEVLGDNRFVLDSLLHLRLRDSEPAATRPDSAFLRSLIDETQGDLRLLSELRRRTQDDFERAAATFKIESKLAFRMFYMGFGLVVIGFATTISGFSLWWARVQRYEDDLIRAAALEAERRR